MKQIKELQAKLKTANEKEQIKLLLGFSEKQKQQQKNEIKQLKKKNKELQKVKDKFQTIAEKTSDIITVSTLELNPKQIYVSPSVKRGLGYTPEEFIGKSFFEYIHPDDKKIIFPLLKKYIQNFAKKILKIGDPSITETIDFRIKNKAGKWRNMQSTINFFGKNLLSVTRDITESKKAEIALQLERYKLTNIFDTMEDGVYIVDKKFNIQYINKKLQKDFGKFDGTKCYEFFHDRKEICTWCKNKEVFKGKTVRWELYVPKNKKTYSLIDTPLTNPDGSISKLEIIHDITESKKAEDALKESETKLRLMIDNSPIGFSATDLKGNYIDVNSAFSKMLGYSKEEMLYKHFNQFSHIDDRAENDKLFEELADGKFSYFDLEKRYIHKNGDIVSVNIRSQIVRDKEDKSLFEIAIIEDITERRKAEEELTINRKQLIESEHILSNILENTNIMTVYLDNKFDFIWVNNAYAEAGRHDASFFTGKNHFELYPNEENQAIFQKVVDTGFSYSIDAKPFEHPDQPKRGTTYWDWSLKPLKNEVGKVVNLVFTLLDVTERKKAEQQLQTEFKRFQTTMDALDAVVYVADMDTYELLFSNKKCNDLFGEHIGEKCYHIAQKGQTKPCDYCTNHLLLDKKGNPKEPHIWEFQNTITLHWYQCRDQAIRWIDGRLVRMEINTDITERKKVDEALVKSEKNYRDLIESLNEGIGNVDENECFTFLNRAGAEIFGYPIEELIGKNLKELTSPGSYKKILEESTARKDGLSTKYEIEIIRKDGEQRIISLAGSPIITDDKKNHGTFGVFSDITERKKAVDTIKAEKKMNELLLNSMPYPIMLINKKRIIIAANKIALDVGVIIGDYCWKEFGKCEYLSDENLKRSKINPDELGIQCTFCKMDEIYKTNKPTNNLAVDAFGRTWDAYWIPLNDDEYLHYMVDVTERKQAEEELKKSKDLLNATQLLSKVGGWKFNLEEQIMHWTDETFLIHELDRTVIGVDFNKYIEQSLLCYDKKDRKIVMDAFQKCVDSGESYDMEFPFTTFKGNRIWIRTTAKAEKENGKVVNVIGNIMDITERKKAEEDLKNSEERFKIMFEFAPDAYYLNDSKGIFIDGNKAAEKLLGYKKEELIGKSLLKLKLTSAKDLPKASKVLLANIQGKSSGPDEFVLNRKDGKRVSVEVTTHPAKIKNEPVVLGIAHDITKRKLVEDELREAKEFAENLLETANSIVVTLDVNASIVTFNRYAEKLLGYKKNEVLGKNWFDLFIPSEDKQKIPDVFIKALQSMPEASQNENEILQKNGEKIVINWNNNVIHNNYGDISGILSIGVDVTERNKTRDELKKYSETQKVLLREVNHRVKNNLSALISMLHKGQDHAEEKGLDSTTVLAVMEERINGLANVHSLLSESEWKPIKLSVLCKQIVSGSMSNLLLTGKVKLIVNRSELMIDSDKAHHLTMVLNELAINTLKYALAKRDIVTITINFKKNKDKIEMCFCDDGPGYPKKLLKGDIIDIGVGFELIRGIVKRSMGGDLQILNDNGANTIITFEND